MSASHKHPFDGDNEQLHKKRHVSERASHAQALVEQAQLKRAQIGVCSKLASILRDTNTRPIDERMEDVIKLLREDSARTQPLINLSYQLQVGSDTIYTLVPCTNG
jgi:hypothetical protein